MIPRRMHKLTVAVFASVACCAYAQSGGGAEGPLPQPLASAVELKLTGAQRFRVGVVVRNAGRFPDKLGRLGTLLGEGTLTPLTEGYFWRIVINRSQVDSYSLSDGEPLVTLELLTDANGRLQGQTVTFTKRMAEGAEGRRHVPYLVASGLALSGIVGMALPSGRVAQGATLGSMQESVSEILAYLEPGVRISTPLPALTVAGTRPFLGKTAVTAAARGPVSFMGTLGAMTVQSESQLDIAIDSGVPLGGLLKLAGPLPGGIGQMDFSVRATLRPY